LTAATPTQVCSSAGAELDSVLSNSAGDVTQILSS